MTHIRVLLRDTQTGDEVWYEYDVEEEYVEAVETQEFWWTDGNAACDCSRLLFLHDALGRPKPDVECSDGRVVIVEATIDGEPQDWH